MRASLIIQHESRQQQHLGAGFTFPTARWSARSRAGSGACPASCRVVWQESPGAATPYDVEDGLEDLTRRIERRTSIGFGSRKVAFQAAPFGIGEGGLICFSHARYPTERAPQNPLSEKAPRVKRKDGLYPGIPLRSWRIASTPKV
jgi:hypothetical protein